MLNVSKTNFLSSVSVGVLLSAYRQADQFLCQNDHSVAYYSQRVCLCWVTGLYMSYRFGDILRWKNKLIQLGSIYIIAPIHAAVSKRCTASSHGQRNTLTQIHIRGSANGSAAWLRVLFLLHASTYIAVVVGTTATFLVYSLISVEFVKLSLTVCH